MLEGRTPMGRSSCAGEKLFKGNAAAAWVGDHAVL